MRFTQAAHNVILNNNFSLFFQFLQEKKKIYRATRIKVTYAKTQNKKTLHFMSFEHMTHVLSKFVSEKIVWRENRARLANNGF